MAGNVIAWLLGGYPVVLVKRRSRDVTGAPYRAANAAMVRGQAREHLFGPEGIG